ncbi:hypothetical protein GOP47_0011637 [Adiantum capillus-veneris]|uniref:Uncharacterized protein n=1 Tax=Adiantum capillus-veneris TaxID=13818 RepID=A0A9D4UT58_ADICA|nr:hypothetical protein GOP47_0011637 [Adiantum capillus-veneris]
MESCVQLGSINIAHAFAASQCRTFTDFLFSTAFRQGSPVQRVDLLPNLDFLRAGDESTTLSISVMDLRKHEELRELGSFLRFLRGLPTSLGTSCTTLSLLNIDFDSLEELDALCDGIASPLCSLTNLDLDFSLEDSQLEQEEITMENAQEQENNKIGAQDRLIKGALLKNTSLQSVSLFSGSIHSDSLYTALARRPPCAIKELQVLLQDNHTLDHVHRILAGLSQNAIALTSLHIRGGDWSRSSTSLKDGERQLATMLETNTSLSALKLQLLYLPGKVIEILFASLEKNLHLTHLSLEGCEGPEWPSASSILDSLRTNGRISRLDLKHTPLETGQRQAAIMAQLERNQENLKQLKVIKSRGSARVKSTTVRLFLCGLPFSGKTTLSTSLVKWNNALSSGKASGSLVKWNSTKSAFSSITRCLSCARDVHVETTHGRTRGIAVSTLENDKVKVSLWDMAGQAEYYAFHDHMFPNIMGELLHFDDKRYQHQGFYTLEFLESLLESKINTQTNDNRSKSNKYGRAKETYVPKIEGKALVKLFMWTICRYGLAKETYVPKIEGKALVKLFMWTICRYGLAKETYVPKIEGKALVKLLIGLRLACQRDDHLEDSDVFIPASLCAVSRVHTPPSLYMKDDEGSTLTFMGRRLKCKNSICTFFTPGIFPLLQVTFNSIFCGIETILQENMIAFSHAGIKVLIEFFKHEGQDHFIDILIRSRLDLDDTIGWVHGELINNIEKVCAEPKGIQGVELVREVIRPRCVKETVSMDKRKNSAVSLQKLRDTLNYHIERKGPRLDCLSVFHDWQMTHDSDRVVDLLGREETIKVVEAYRRTFIAEVEDVLGINIEKEDCGSKGPDQKVFHSTPSGKERAYIYNGVKEACRGIQEMHKDIREMQKDIKRIGEDMQRQCQSLLPKLSQRMHELLTFFNEREMARLPRMFVVTKDNGGRIRKIVGAMLPSLENVRLELLCEHRSQPHLVEEQRGLSFVTLEDGLLKQGLPYIRLFLKIAGVVMKVGAHVAAGLGDAIPDFTRVLAAVANAPASSTSTQFQALSSPDHRSRLCFQKGQKWLQDVLLRYNCCTNETIHEKFGLSRVQYGDLHVGWLCDTHGAEGELYPI